MIVLIPIAGFSAAVIGHALWRRAFPGRTAVFTFIFSSVFWAGVISAIAYERYELTIALTTSLLYGLACELYLFVFTLSSHSVSARLLAVLGDGPRRTIDLERVCDPNRMVQQRKIQMVQTGLLAGEASDYHLTDKGRRVLRTFDRLNRFFFPTAKGH
jgi:hypothetical protein